MEARFTDMIKTQETKKWKGKKHHEPKLKQLEKDFSDTTNKTNIYEVWFSGALLAIEQSFRIDLPLPGCHCGMSDSASAFLAHELTRLLDVGGGAVKNDTPHALSRIPL